MGLNAASFYLGKLDFMQTRYENSLNLSSAADIMNACAFDAIMDFYSGYTLVKENVYIGSSASGIGYHIQELTGLNVSVSAGERCAPLDIVWTVWDIRGR